VAAQLAASQEGLSSMSERVIIIIMDIQPFTGPWPLFQFLDPVHSL
jgi:hypothetical protein